MSEYIKREDAIKRLCDFSQEGIVPMPYELWENVLRAVPSADVVPYYDYRELKKKYDKLEEDYDDLTEFHTGAMMYLTEVVRCKDCKYWHDWHCAEPVISPWEGRTNKSARSMNDYCSYGERKDGDKE